MRTCRSNLAAALAVAACQRRRRDQRAAFRAVGIRLNSGDLAALAVRARGILDDADLTRVRVVVSGGLDEFAIAAMQAAGAPVDLFAVGTKVETSADAPYLDAAYKLVDYGGRPVRKLSTRNVTLPGAKQVHREPRLHRRAEPARRERPRGHRTAARDRHVRRRPPLKPADLADPVRRHTSETRRTTQAGRRPLGRSSSTPRAPAGRARPARSAPAQVHVPRTAMSRPARTRDRDQARAAAPKVTHARGNRALVTGHRLVTDAAERAGTDPHQLTSCGASTQLRQAVAALASTGEHGSPLSPNRLFAVGRGGLLIKRVRRGCSGRWGGVVARLPWVHGVGQVRHPRRRLRTDRLQRDPGRVHAVEQAGAGAEKHR